MARTLQELMNLRGQTALITGGSRGLGLQMASALGELGARLVLSARKAHELEAAAAQLRAQGVDCSTVVADGSQDEDVQRLAQTAIERLGQIDILVNNAGASWGAPAEDHPVASWDKVMDLNIRGIFLLTQLIGRHSMLPRRRGSIINVASIAGLGGNPQFMKTIAYNTSKGACITFTQALAAEWGPSGIRVNAIAPGSFETKMAAPMFANGGAARLAANVPLRRTGDDEDLKGVVALLATDAGKHMTGQIIAVDGGVSAVIAA